MDEERLIAFLRENLRIESETKQSYNGGMGGGSMYDDYTVISLWLGDEKISETSL
jgi:hypothetical protein